MPKAKTKIKERKMKVFYNPEMEDLPFPEPLSYKLLVEVPQELKDINEAEGIKLTGIESGAMNLSNHTSDDLPEGSTNQYLLDGAVTEIKLAALAVSEAKIAVGAITEAKIAADAITTNKIANATITASKIHADYKILEIVSSLPSPGTAGRLVYLTTDGKIYRDNGTVFKQLILPSEVTDHLGGEGVGTIGSVKIDAGAITEAKLAASAVTETKIADGSISSPKIVAGAITAGKIAAGAVETGKLAALAVTTEKIAADAVTAGKIAANSVNTSELVAGAVTSDIIATNAVIAGKIAAGAVVADKIATDAVTAVKIQAGAVTTEKIYAGAVTSDKINVSQLSAISANIGLCTAGTLRGVQIESAASGQRIIIYSTAINFYNSSDQNVANIYAGSNDLLIKNQITSKNIFIDGGSGGYVTLGTGGTIRLQVGASVIEARQGIAPYSTDSYPLGLATKRWTNLYIQSGGRIYAGGSYGIKLTQTYYGGYYDTKIEETADILPGANNIWELGSSSLKWYAIYRTNEYSCPLPTTNSALAIIKKIKAPKVFKGDYGERHYFKDKDFPEEMKAKVNKTKGKQEIEITRTIGVTVQAVRELVEENEALKLKIEDLEQKVDSLTK